LGKKVLGHAIGISGGLAAHNKGALKKGKREEEKASEGRPKRVIRLSGPINHFHRGPNVIGPPRKKKKNMGGEGDGGRRQRGEKRRGGPIFLLAGAPSFR